MSDGISYETQCESCEVDIEVMLYKRSSGRFDPSGRSRSDEPPCPPYSVPDECPECQHPILIEDIEHKVMQHEVAAAEHRAGL